MKRVHIEHIVHTGAETVNDQLAGTVAENAIGNAGRMVRVGIAVVNNTALTAYWSARGGGKEIARKSYCPFKADGATPESAIMHWVEVPVGAKLDLEITVAGASTSCVLVVMES